MQKKLKAWALMTFTVVPLMIPFVMNAWADPVGLKNVKVIADGSGNFTRFMGMLIGKKSFRLWK